MKTITLIFILASLMMSCTPEPPKVSGCETQIVSRVYDKETERFEEIILLHCKDSVYYFQEEELLYRFPTNKK